MPSRTTVLCFLLTISAISQAQDPSELSIPPSSAPTSLATSSSRPTLQESQSPSTPPSKSLDSEATNKPNYYGGDDPLVTYCADNPDFFMEFWEYDQNCKRSAVKLACSDYRAKCFGVDLTGVHGAQYGNLGDIRDYCCKCKEACTSTGQCGHLDNTPPPDPDYSSGCDVKKDFVPDDNDTDNGDLPTIAIVFGVLIGVGICAVIVRYTK